MEQAFETLANELLAKANAIIEETNKEPDTYTQAHSVALFDLYFAGHNLAKLGKLLGASKKEIERVIYEANLFRDAAQEYADKESTCSKRVYLNLPYTDDTEYDDLEQ